MTGIEEDIMRPKRLTRAQKIALSERGVNPMGYQVLRELPNSIIVKHRLTGDIKVIDKDGGQ